jgi:hypothetical protein
MRRHALGEAFLHFEKETNTWVRFTKQSYPKIYHKYVLSSSLRDL